MKMNNKGSVKVVLAIMIPVLILLLGACGFLYYLKTEKDRAAKAQKEVEQQIKDEGEAAALEVGVHGIHPELIKNSYRFTAV